MILAPLVIRGPFLFFRMKPSRTSWVLSRWLHRVSERSREGRLHLWVKQICLSGLVSIMSCFSSSEVIIVSVTHHKTPSSLQSVMLSPGTGCRLLLHWSGWASITTGAIVFFSMHCPLDAGAGAGAGAGVNKHLVLLTLGCSTMLIGSIWEKSLVSPTDRRNCWAGLCSGLASQRVLHNHPTVSKLLCAS